MTTRARKAPREHLSSLFNKDVIRYEHWRKDGAQKASLIILKKDVIRNEHWRREWRQESIFIICNKDVIRNEHWKEGREPREHFSSFPFGNTSRSL